MTGAPAPSAGTVVRTYYERPWRDRWTGRYTVAWDGGRVRAHTRFQDLQGRWPSWRSVLALPMCVASYWEARSRPLLKRPRPFLVVDAIRFLERTIRPGHRVLEVGGGNSTLWFLERGATVTTVEHDPEWAAGIEVRYAAERERFARAGSGGLSVHVLGGRKAVDFLEGLEGASFDLALIDCANAVTLRVEALRAARPKVKSGGWLVLDNSDHPQNWAAARLMSGCAALRFTGFAPMSLGVSQTSAWRV
ncbi:MAG TPA: class I SAM-dependent methyltransferase [Planctomycetota bacterium]|nr:class I SAM-dependent methyltransferase [Planctomycetota bacterium]